VPLSLIGPRLLALPRVGTRNARHRFRHEAITRLMRGRVTTAHDDRDGSQAVLLIDECVCDSSSDWALAHTSLSSGADVWSGVCDTLAVGRQAEANTVWATRR
jgi:hypothetical protein